jgi:hypothetical protein
MNKNNPETQRVWYTRNAEKLKKQRSDYYYENKEMLLVKHQARCKLTPRYSFSATLCLARKRAVVTIDQDHLMGLYDQQEGLCALSGVRMTWATGRWSPTSISMDRIDNNSGYIAGNVRLVCVAVNAFRGTMNDQELLKMAKSLVSTMESKRVYNKALEGVTA